MFVCCCCCYSKRASGLEDFEREKIAAQRRLDEAQKELFKPPVQEQTNWSVEAVVDEDELFK